MSRDGACSWLPESAFGPLCLANALRKLERPAEARDVLLPIADKFLKEWCIPFQLACCFAQLGLIKDCESWLKEAMAIDEAAVQKSAVDDPDLIPLWKRMKGSLWRRELRNEVSSLGRRILTITLRFRKALDHRDQRFEIIFENVILRAMRQGFRLGLLRLVP